MKRDCLVCGEKVIGRSDKKFCGDACRNTYNNALNRDTNNRIRNINNQLRKNHRILQKLNPNLNTKVSKATLVYSGFSFDYFTGITHSKNGDFMRCVYDQAYMPLKDEQSVLIKKIDPPLQVMLTGNTS